VIQLNLGYGFFTLKKKLPIKKNKKNDIISYRPNHMDRRGRNRWTTHIAPKWSPLGTGGPCLILPHIHIVILKGQGNYLKKKDIIKKIPEKKEQFSEQDYEKS
jgi:hypothetical protein